MHAALNHWLRLLWGTAPPVAFDSDRAYIAGGAIHLPPRPHWRQHHAAAAHAAAHLVYSPKCFDGAGLGPIARVLLAVLEDARIEALAVREFPGLARLWRPLHTARPEAGVGFDGLTARLARSLCDPAYDDPDPWIRKARALAFLDPALTIPALRTPAELRAAATRLGHDIGQRRLPFDAEGPPPLPAYRDDHRWMWAADALSTAPPPPSAAASPGAVDEPPDVLLNVTEHPEWDRLIARLRPAWCRVVETGPVAAPATGIADATQVAARHLAAPLDALTRRSARAARSDTGDAFGLDALVQRQVARRLNLPAEPRVYRNPRTVAAPTRLWLPSDPSASTAAADESSEDGALQRAVQAALALSLALRNRRIAFGIAAFSTNGRHAVQWRTLKSFDTPVDDARVGRLQALRPQGSTRLGAVLRHALRHSTLASASPSRVLLLSDGSPHDIDVHGPLYLVEDARRAVAGAGRFCVRMGCLVLEPDTGDATLVFGARGAVRVCALEDLPGALRRLLG